METAVDPDGDEHADILHPDCRYDYHHVHLRATHHPSDAPRLGTPLVCECHHWCFDRAVHLTLPSCDGNEKEPQ